jgi:hypothetical protein
MCLRIPFTSISGLGGPILSKKILLHSHVQCSVLYCTTMASVQNYTLYETLVSIKKSLTDRDQLLAKLSNALCMALLLLVMDRKKGA